MTRNQRGAADTAGSADDGNEIYTAHQVHTLAQLMLQQIARSQPPAAPWSYRAIGVAPEWPPTQTTQGSHLVWGPTQLFTYWYP